MRTIDLDRRRPALRTRHRNAEREIPAEWPLAEVGECVLCCRPVRLTPDTIWVECVGGALNATPKGAALDRDDPSYMGCYPVGPGCARKIPAAYRWKERAA